jgi:hypothetical protein
MHFLGKVNMELQLDATITVFIVIVTSSWSSIFTLPTLMMHGQTQIKHFLGFRAVRQGQ